MFNYVYHSHLPPPCLSKAELLTQSSPFLFMVPLWSHCRSRSLILMLSVNEAACIVHGVMKRRHDLHTVLEGFFFLCTRARLFCRPVTENSGHTLTFNSCACASWVRGERGDGCTGRRSQEVACPFTVISASAVLSYLHQISDCFVVVIWQQLLTVRHLQFWFWILSRIRQTTFPTKSYGTRWRNSVFDDAHTGLLNQAVSTHRFFCLFVF